MADGCRVRIELENKALISGMPEEDQPDAPEAIAKWLAEFDAIPAWNMTAAEEVEWQAARQAAKE
jgi:hypothetical protein